MRSGLESEQCFSVRLSAAVLWVVQEWLTVKLKTRPHTMSRTCCQASQCCWSYDRVGVEGAVTSPLTLRHTILVLINPLSGNTTDGQRILSEFQSLLPNHTYDISANPSQDILSSYVHTEHLRIIVGGGDGTVGSILDQVRRTPFLHRPHIATLPLGTGNELSRVLKWGKLFESSVFEFLRQVDESQPIFLDQWEISDNTSSQLSIERLSSSLSASIPSEDGSILLDGEVSHEMLYPPARVMNCFMSFGVDAQITASFTRVRESHPSLCKNRTVNKIWYTVFGVTSFFTSHSIARLISVMLDDEREVEIPSGVEGVVLLNIPSTADGTNPWNRGFLQGSEGKGEEGGEGEGGRGKEERGYQPQRIDDGYLEVIGLTGLSHSDILKDIHTLTRQIFEIRYFLLK